MKSQTDAGHERQFIVDAASDGARLDRALEPFLPDAGLRLRRRLIETGRVLVEGRTAPAGLKVRAGQRLTLLPDQGGPQAPVALPIAARTKDYVALEKPANLHSAALAGGGGPSLEALLPALFPDQNPRLLNRLDFLTSGLVLAALNARAAKAFAAIAPKDMTKEYLAVVQGRLDEHLQLKRQLDAEDRKRTRVLGRLDAEPRNWTLVWPKRQLDGDRTLVRVRIQAGARHQIRAHLSAADLPIVGDPLYGQGEAGGLFLHHHLLEFPGFRAESKPPWLAQLAQTPGSDADTALGETI